MSQYIQGKTLAVSRRQVSYKEGTPSQAEAKALAALFPTSSSRENAESQSSIFDPNAECVVSDRQKKKKAAKRPVKVTIIMMKNYCTIMPKNKERKQLEFQGRSKDFKILRSASDAEIHDLINHAFNVSSFTVLESDSSGHNLLKCPIQRVNGEFAVSRRGCLYLCESFEVCI